MPDPIYVAKGESELYLLPNMANRHGLITGATGTGKTVTLQGLAEGFSKIGVPIFMADVKGDLSGISQAGTESPAIADRVKKLGLSDFNFAGCPVAFWDVFGEQGHPIRATMSEMGPLFLSRILNLNEIQTGVLTLTFKIADDNGLLLLDLKDLQAMLQYIGDNTKDFTTKYGNISAASVGAIQRGLIEIDQQGGVKFFGEPALDLLDFVQTASDGRGVVNILAADKLMRSPRLYATFLLWLLAELFERLPEVGDPDKPKLVFFFDEAHLLFNEAPKVLLEKIEQLVRLVRSKGVGVYFVTQNPLDVPDTVLGQLGNRVQHALRAFSPRDQKAVKAAATTFRANPKLDTETVITQLGVGEALVSMLDEKGSPAIVERAFILPPHSKIGPITPEQRQQVIKNSVIFGHYEKMIDRESAYEILKGRAEHAAQEEAATAAQKQAEFEHKQAEKRAEMERKQAEKEAREQERAAARQKPSETTKVIGAFASSAARSIGSTFGRQILRGVMDNIFGGTKRSR